MFSKSMIMFPIPIQTHCFCFSSCVSPMTVAQCKQRGLSAYAVLGQGLSSVRDSAALFLSHYCAQLQNKLMAWLQSGSNTVVHLYISNSMLAAESYDLALIIALCWWGMHVQYKALFQKCLTVSYICMEMLVGMVRVNEQCFDNRESFPFTFPILADYNQ